MEHYYRDALKVKYKGILALILPKSLFQLSGVHDEEPPSWELIVQTLGPEFPFGALQLRGNLSTHG